MNKKLICGFLLTFLMIISSFSLVSCANVEGTLLTVKVQECEHGELELNKEKGEVGELISVIAIPDKNYEVLYVKHNKTTLGLTDLNTYEFQIVPGENLLSAKFVLSEDKDEESKEETLEPTTKPTIEPTKEPSKEPTVEPTKEPSKEPTKEETLEPTIKPTEEEKPKPTPTPKPEVGDLPEINFIRVLTNEPKNLYAWTDNNKVVEYFGKWPGMKMKAYDDTWYYLDLPEELTFCKVIFNIDNSQTRNLEVEGHGYHWFKNNQWSHTNKYGGDFSNNNPGGNPDKPIDPVTASSYKDFKLWEEMRANPKKYQVVNKYQGNRHDFRDETIYFAMTTRFYDGDTGNNVFCWDGKKVANDPEWRGDFKGLIERLDYIKALGFTAVWITPIVENASGLDYHGYHALNMSKVDPRYESSDCSFQDLINACHSKDMKIILDVVFNHTGNFGEVNLLPLLEKRYQDISELSSIDCMKMPKNSHLSSDYFNMTGGEQYQERIAKLKNERRDGSDPNYIYHHYGNFSYESFGEQVAQIAGDCVDLNTENPYVAEYLVKCYGNFIRMGVDYFRIDTFKHISRLTWNNYFLPSLYEYAKLCGNDEFYCFGEVCTRVREVWNHQIPALSAPFYTWKESKSYPWGDAVTNLASIEEAYEDNKSVNNEPTSTNAKLNGLNYHKPDYRFHSGASVIDFPMHWNFYYANKAFDVAVNNDQYYNDATFNVVYVDSHDYAPDDCQRVRYDRGTKAWAENLALMFTFRGVPCIYYGSEVEFQKGMPIDEGGNTPLSKTGRAYFGDYLSGSIKATDFGEYVASGNVKNTLNKPLALHLQDLNKMRSMVKALRVGQYTTNYVNGNMAYIRRYTDSETDSLALVTVSGSASFNSIPNGTYVDLVTGNRINVTNHRLSASCSGMGNLRVYVLENSSTGKLERVCFRSPFMK